MEIALSWRGTHLVLIFCSGVSNGSFWGDVDDLRDVLPMKVVEVEDKERVGHLPVLDESAAKEEEFIVDDGHCCADQGRGDVAGGDTGSCGQVRDGLEAGSRSWHA